MENTINLQQPIRVATAKVDARELIQQQAELIQQQSELIQQQAELILQQAEEISVLRQENDQLRKSVDELVNTITMLKELEQELRDEIAYLKGQKPKPNIRPSKLEGQNSKPHWHTRIGLHDNQRRTVLFSDWVKSSYSNSPAPLYGRFLAITSITDLKKAKLLKLSKLARLVIKKILKIGKPGQPKGKTRNKKIYLEIHEKTAIQPEHIPDGAIFKGFRCYAVQDIVFKSHNTQYQIARWQLLDGSYLTGALPKGVQGHYGPELISYILYQYHACRVTEPLLLDQLRFLGVLISAGQLNNILIENKDAFVKEVEELLPIAVKVEEQLQADDTGGRHRGKNQYTTIIGNKWFTIFATTDSKSRINFLRLLQNSKDEYLISEDTLEYLKEAAVADYLPGYIALYLGCKFTTLADWQQFLKERNIAQEAQVRFVTEAALYGSLIANGIPHNLGIHSDDAGQFAVFYHSLCWIHEERHYRKLIMTTEQSRAELEGVRNQIWKIYNALKSYKENPKSSSADALEMQFDAIFQQETSSPTLNHQLKKTHGKKQNLLKVLQRPGTPLHNNSSERCARSAKIKLKVSGGTRSDLGKKIRDTFLSLKQTCLKLHINFFAFIQDRVRGLYEIPRLEEIIRIRSSEALPDPPC